MQFLKQLLTYRIRLEFYTTSASDHRRHGLEYWFRLYNDLLDIHAEACRKGKSNA